MVNRYFLDTNAVIALLQGNQQLQDMIKEANRVGISVITEIEFFAYDKLDSEGRELFNQFYARVEQANLNGHDRDLILECIRLRKETGIKLPDAVIAAQSRLND